MGIKISGGTLKGRSLQFPDAAGLRPTSSRVRESIFSAITSHYSLEGVLVADFFSGSGVLGFEALSRGASKCNFIERNKHLLASIGSNSVALGLEDKQTTIQLDIERWIERPKEIFNEKIDFVFIDPPYELDLKKEIAAKLIYQLLQVSDFCKSSVYVVEQSVKAPSICKLLEKYQPVIASAVWEREYGDTRVTFVVGRDMTIES